MRFLISRYLLFALVSVLISSCKKYPDGPGISFRSKTSRIGATWYLEQYFLNDVDETDPYYALYGQYYWMTISRSGAYQIYGNFPENGACHFSNKHKIFVFQPFGSLSVERNCTILRLEYKSFWFKYVQSNGDVEEFHYKCYR